ncbi:YeeE/YedE family protein [Poseidonocella sp. HB161398]|uniref:YeeE/YedE family protein n=1 Tax=Poseidonocella sp. HB161398 TaxID=2320855 RepID=UPI001107B35B|nr:YeeE/YedE family protein [Poseidonocella sp. HB161398]
MTDGMLAALAGLATGGVLGLAARMGNFCTLGAIEHALYGTDRRRLRQWGIVLGTAVLATQAAGFAGWADLQATAYRALAWSPLASILGGLLFGYGMAMAGNCGFGALVRFGGGDLRSMVVVVVTAIAGFAALSGPLAPLRVALFPQVPAAAPTGIAHDISRAAGLSEPLVAALLGLALLGWGLAHAPLRARPGQVAWGVAAGLAVAWAFVATSWLGARSFGAIGVEGPSYVAPLGRSLLWLMTSTAGGLSFATGSVAGVMAGGFAGSVLRGMFRWEACEDPRELGRQVGGAVAMGIGGVVAMGCSVGQGVSGTAVLAWSGPVTLAAIAAGAAAGLHRLIGGCQPE